VGKWLQWRQRGEEMDKILLITGASRGICAVTASHWPARGAMSESIAKKMQRVPNSLFQIFRIREQR